MSKSVKGSISSERSEMEKVPWIDCQVTVFGNWNCLAFKKKRKRLLLKCVHLIFHDQSMFF